jgi:hypothetical protein
MFALPASVVTRLISASERGNYPYKSDIETMAKTCLALLERTCGVPGILENVV